MATTDDSGQLLVEIIDSIEDGAAIFDADHRLVTFNDRYTQYFTLIEDILKPGVSFQEMFQALGERGLYDGPKSEIADWVVQRTKLFVDGAQGIEMERVGGNWVRIDYYKLKSGGTFVVTADITEKIRAADDLRRARDELELRVEERTWELTAEIAVRKQTELALQHSEQRFMDFAASSSDWLWEMDEELRISYVSPNIKQITGKSAEWHYGKTRQELMGDNYDPKYWENHLRQMQNREPFKDFVYQRNFDDMAPRWQSTSGVPIFDEDGNFRGYRGTSRDITRRKAMEARLAQADKLSTLSTLAAGTAHELSQPLNIIRLIIDSITLDPENAGPAISVEKQDLEQIVAQVIRMAEIIDSMRVLSRGKDDPTEIFVPSTIIRDLLALVSGQFADDDVTINAILPGDGGLISGSPSQLEQVVLNLLTNAREAIVARRRSQDSPDNALPGLVTIELKIDTAAQRVIVTVDDNGGGISDSILDKIFDPFFTTKEVGQGAGLGLSVGHSLIAAMGGDLDAENIGDGVRFRISLPLENIDRAESA